VIDNKRLIGNEHRLDADWQIGTDLAHRLLDVPAQGQDVATLTHGHCNADRRPAVDAKHRLRRIGIGPVNSGDVAQPD
jgi:hypothetical protein